MTEQGFVYAQTLGNTTFRSCCTDMFLRKGPLKTCSKFTGEHPYRSAISIKLLSNFIEIALRHECSPVNFLHIFRTPFFKNTSGWLLLYIACCVFKRVQWLFQDSFFTLAINQFVNYLRYIKSTAFKSNRRQKLKLIPKSFKN